LEFFLHKNVIIRLLTLKPGLQKEKNKDDVERKKHSGNIGYFREHYIATGIFDKLITN